MRFVWGGGFVKLWGGGGLEGIKWGMNGGLNGGLNGGGLNGGLNGGIRCDEGIGGRGCDIKGAVKMVKMVEVDDDGG